MGWMTRHVLAWTTTAASTLTLAQIVAPRFVDIVLDILVVVLVYIAAKLGQMNLKDK